MTSHVFAQLAANDRGFAEGMLNNTKEELKRHYYDPTFRGIDLDYVWEQANQKLRNDTSRDAMMMTIASAVLTLDDSHTTFFPPARAADIEYGWRLGAVGDDCYVTAVKPRSDAAAKGLRAGDRVLLIDGVKPTRNNLWRIYYRLFGVMPVTRVAMLVARPGEESPLRFEIDTKISRTAGSVDYEALWVKILRNGWDKTQKDRYFTFGNELMIWRMSSFMMSESALDSLMSKARDHKSLILDLRDNGGGYVDNLKRLLGHFFDRDIKIGDQKARKTTKAIVAKSRGSQTFKGNLIVLIDHGSASASEVFARIVQIEKRGRVLGDRSRGAVMESKFYSLNLGVGNVLYYGLSIAVADLIMADGKSLERVGATPDETLLPTSVDLAMGRDPLISHASKLLGVDISPEKAGTFFPIDWDHQ